MSWAHCRAVARKSAAPSSAAVPPEIWLPPGEEPGCCSCTTGCGTMWWSAAQPKDVMGKSKGNLYHQLMPTNNPGIISLSFIYFPYIFSFVTTVWASSTSQSPHSHPYPKGRCPAFQVFNSSCARHIQPWSSWDQPTAFPPGIFQCEMCVSRASEWAHVAGLALCFSGVFSFQWMMPELQTEFGPLG